MKRDAKILQAAERLFAERSFAGVGVDEIGRAAGITGSAIYRHFTSKDEILAVLFDQAIDTLLQSLGEPRADPAEELERLIGAHVELATSRQLLAIVWVREQGSLSPAFRRAYQRRQHRYVERWLDCLALCYPDRDPDELVTAVRGVQALLMSDALRPTGSRAGAQAPAFLVVLARAALRELGSQPLAKVSKASSSASGASSIG